jgi:hypothetical protein
VLAPSSCQFTSEDGTVYEVEKKKGLRRMQDRNGKTIDVSPSGVILSTGRGILFARDSAGRITKMTDPSGSALAYEYDVKRPGRQPGDRHGPHWRAEVAVAALARAV